MYQPLNIKVIGHIYLIQFNFSKSVYVSEYRNIQIFLIELAQ